MILMWVRVVKLRNPHGKSSHCRKEAPPPHAQRQYHNQAQLNWNKYISTTSTSEASSCPEAALPAAFVAIMRAACSSNLQMFSTYRRVNQVKSLATKTQHNIDVNKVKVTYFVVEVRWLKKPLLFHRFLCCFHDDPSKNDVQHFHFPPPYCEIK